MTNNHSAGGQINAWCTKCKLELEHTIIAMVDDLPKKVKCNTCGGQHNYRTAPSVKTRTGAVRKRRPKGPTYEEHISRLTGGDPSRAKPYVPSGHFEEDEVIDHPTFGLGIVLSTIKTDKMEILFKDGPRLLIQNQQ